MLARAATWWTILRIALEERLVYRGDFALGTVMRFLPIITQIFLWWAVFESVGDGNRSGGRIAGYGFENVVAYYLLTMVSRAFSSMPGLASGIALQIRNDGSLYCVYEGFLVCGVMGRLFFLTKISFSLAGASLVYSTKTACGSSPGEMNSVNPAEEPTLDAI